MRGYHNYNFQQFEDATAYLRWLGHVVVSPHEIDIEQGWVGVKRGRTLEHAFTDVWTTDTFDFKQAIKRDIREITEVDAVAFLPMWKLSQGSQIENQVREWCGLPRYLVKPWLYFIMDEQGEVAA